MRGHLGCAVGTECTDVYMCRLALGHTVMAKRGDSGPLSRMGKLVQCLDEDVESLGWVIVTAQPMGHCWAGPIFEYCSAVL